MRHGIMKDSMVLILGETFSSFPDFMLANDILLRRKIEFSNVLRMLNKA